MTSGSAAVAIALVTMGLGWVVMAGAVLIGTGIGFIIAKAAHRDAASGANRAPEVPPLAQASAST